MSSKVPALVLPSGLITIGPNDRHLENIPMLFSSDDKDDDSNYDINLDSYNIAAKPTSASKQRSPTAPVQTIQAPPPAESLAEQPPNHVEVNITETFFDGGSPPKLQTKAAWSRLYDDTYQRYYLHNEATGESQWEEDAPVEVGSSAPDAADAPNKETVDASYAGWMRLRDDASGAHYLYNSATGETKWESELGTPGGSPSKSAGDSPTPLHHHTGGTGVSSDGWCEYFDMSGNKYYFNEVTGEYSWHLPTADASFPPTTSPDKTIAVTPIKLDTSAVYKASPDVGVETYSDLLAETESVDSLASDMAELQIIKQKFEETQKDLRAAEAEEEDAGSVGEDSAEHLIRTVLSSSIAMEWRWPWTTLYDTKRKRVFYYNEELGTLQVDNPMNAKVRVHSSLAHNMQLLNAEVLRRRLLFATDQRSSPPEDMSTFCLCEELLKAPPSLVMRRRKEVISCGAFELVEELAEANEHHLIDRNKAPVPSRWSRDLAAAERVIVRLKPSIKATILAPPESPLQRPSSSPQPRKHDLRPFTTMSAGRVRTVPLSLSSTELLSSVVKTSNVKDIVVSLLMRIDEAENRSLREQIYSKHIMAAVQRQRSMVESFRGGVLTVKNGAPSSPATMRSPVAKVRVTERSIVSSSLEDMISANAMSLRKGRAQKFERDMDQPDYLKYIGLLKEIATAPYSIDALLHLVDHLLACKAYLQAITCVSKAIEEKELYKLTDIEVLYVEMLHIRLCARYKNKFPKESKLKKMASLFPEDANLLSFVGDELKLLSYTEDAEVYYVASLVRDPTNNAALRGYGLLLASKGDFAGATKYLSRVTALPAQSIGWVSKLETAWCSELANNGDGVTLQCYLAALQPSAPKKLQSLVYSCMGHLFLRRNETVKAESSLLKAVQVSDDNPHGLLLFACVHPQRDSDSVKRCGLYFEKGIELLRQDKSAAEWIAHLGHGDFNAFLAGNFDLAENAYRRSIAFRKSTLPLIAYIDILKKSKVYNETVVLANIDWTLRIVHYLANKEDLSSVYVAIAYVFLEMGDFEKAEGLLDVVQRKHDISPVYRCLAYIALRKGSEDAPEIFSAALSISNKNPFTLRSCAANLAIQGDFKRALEVIVLATTIDPYESRSWEMRAILTYIIESDLNKTLTYLDTSTKFIPTVDATRMKGQILFELGKLVEAADVLAQVLLEYPNDCITMVTLLLCYDAILTKGKSDIPLAVSTTAATGASPPKTKPPYKYLITKLLEKIETAIGSLEASGQIPSEVYYRLGMYYLNAKQKKSAKAVLLQGARAMHPLCVYMLGWIYETAGQIQESEEYYSRSFEMRPFDPVLFSKLRTLTESTYNYVKELHDTVKSKAKILKTKKLKRIKKSVDGGETLVLRLLLHERIKKKMVANDLSGSISNLKGTGKLYIDPLWTIKFLFLFGTSDSWVTAMNRI